MSSEASSDEQVIDVAERTYAKVSPVRYGPGDALELRWTTYRAS